MTQGQLLNVTFEQLALLGNFILGQTLRNGGWRSDCMKYIQYVTSTHTRTRTELNGKVNTPVCSCVVLLNYYFAGNTAGSLRIGQNFDKKSTS